jgi:hypothetical protein
VRRFGIGINSNDVGSAMKVDRAEIEELLRLLSINSWRASDVSTKAERLVFAYENPFAHVAQEADDAWVIEGMHEDEAYCAEILLSWVLFDALDDLIQPAEWLVAWAERESGQSAPRRNSSWSTIWAWVNTVLAKEQMEQGGLQVLQYDDGASDEVHVLKVHRRSVQRILAIASPLGIKLSDPTNGA